MHKNLCLCPWIVTSSKILSCSLEKWKCYTLKSLPQEQKQDFMQISVHKKNYWHLRKQNPKSKMLCILSMHTLLICMRKSEFFFTQETFTVWFDLNHNRQQFASRILPLVYDLFSRVACFQRERGKLRGERTMDEIIERENGTKNGERCGTRA